MSLLGGTYKKESWEIINSSLKGKEYNNDIYEVITGRYNDDYDSGEYTNYFDKELFNKIMNEEYTYEGDNYGEIKVFDEKIDNVPENKRNYTIVADDLINSGIFDDNDANIIHEPTRKVLTNEELAEIQAKKGKKKNDYNLN